MKPQFLLTLGFFIVIVAVVMVSKCEKEPDLNPSIIARLQKDTANQNKRIQALKGTIKILDQRIVDIDKRATRAENEAAGLKKRRVVLENVPAPTERDSLVKYVKLDANCDSLIVAYDSAVSNLKDEIKIRISKSEVQDSIIGNLEAKVRSVSAMDSTHVSILKEAIKDGKRKKRTGILIGAGIAILALIL